MSDKPATPPGVAGDPSMEDILASIRRILSEDEPAPGEPAAAQEEPPPAHASPPPEPDVLVLDPSMMVPEPTPPSPPTSPPPGPVLAAPEPPPFQPEPPPADQASGLVAPAAAAAAASSVGVLVRTLAERATQVHRGGPTIEDIVRDEIRPILKDWLDQNLPPIVEHLVRIEIERVVGRAVP